MAGPGRPGRPPKPIEQKRRLGNPGKRPLPTNVIPLEPLSPIDLGDATDPLVSTLIDAGAIHWLARTDLPILEVAKQLWLDQALLRRSLDGEFSRDVFNAYIATLKELRACLSLLGLTPTDRSRLGVAEVKARSTLEKLMDRRGSRADGRRAS